MKKELEKYIEELKVQVNELSSSDYGDISLGNIYTIQEVISKLQYIVGWKLLHLESM